jgi:hypothetical protein
MKLFIFLLIGLLFVGCVNIDYPDGLVKLVMFTSHIVDVEKHEITSKEELIEFVDTAKTWGSIYDGYKGRHVFSMGHFYKGSLRVQPTPSDSFIVYVNPLSHGKPVLDKRDYVSGMPVRAGRGWYHVVLIKGNLEWADHSYEHNGEKYVILPVCNSSDDCEDLDFTWTIGK